MRGPDKRMVPRPEPGRLDVDGILESFANHMMYSVAKDEFTATDFDVYQGLALAVWDRLMERWFATQKTYYRSDAKRVYYLSMEFLMGRALLHNILNLGAHDAYREAMAELGYDLAAVQEQEWDAGLGNGGLGRLAACFLDSAATLALPFYGYGIRYEFGIFTQRIQDGWQVESPDSWLRYRNPWEIPRPDAIYPVDFYGRVERVDGRARARARPLGGHRGRHGHGLRHAGRGLQQRHREHAAAVGGQGDPRVRPRALPGRRVRAGGRGQGAQRVHLQGPVPARRPARGQGAAAQAAVLLRVGDPPGHPPPVPQEPRATGGGCPTRSPSSSTTPIRRSPSPS